MKQTKYTISKKILVTIVPTNFDRLSLSSVKSITTTVQYYSNKTNKINSSSEIFHTLRAMLKEQAPPGAWFMIEGKRRVFVALQTISRHRPYLLECQFLMDVAKYFLLVVYKH